VEKMTTERISSTLFKGHEATILGDDLKVGQVAPEFTAQNNAWEDVRALASTRGKVRIIASLLSLATSVCDRETRRFEEIASQYNDLRILVLSMDLPFTQENWCGAAGIKNLTTLSDHMNGDFGLKYGLLLKEFRFHRRAIFVVNRDDRLVHVEYVPKMGLGVEPDYDAAIQAAQKALEGEMAR
jgi:thiol peroxidase